MKFLVFIEQREGKIRKASLEALSLARRLSGGPVAAVLPGQGVTALTADLGKYGAGVVYVADQADLALYSNKGYVGALDAATGKENPDAVLIAATAMGKDVAPRFAARRDVSVLADVMDLRLEGDRLIGSRPVYSGKARAEVDCGSAKLQIATTRPNVFAAEARDAPAPRVEALALGDVAPRARVLKVETSETKELDVAEADIIVSGGRGIKGPENWPVVRDLQQALGAALGASRAVVDAGWIDHQHQVGQTGKVVSPSLYVACGISGAIQHLAGMGTSKVIVAINKDPEAPIFKVATYGIVGDLFSIVPEVAKAVRAAKAE
ncbi:MAG TPA: electron transfer flavoprotein subunit alpha/FixB family protein [Thermoanaerobaculia bacterium]|nr:electron transfer flavoprotein subunit alpha/FixB family protein [Thermoanaerobaculia bacterium]